MKNASCFFLSAAALISMLCVYSCNKDDSSAGTDSPQKDYSQLILGHWWNIDIDTPHNVTKTLAVGSRSANSLVYYDVVDNDWGVTARGTFQLNGSALKAIYDNVSVNDEHYESSSRNGFVDGEAKIINYTINSCDGKKLVMTDDENNKTTWEKYAELK